MCTQVYHMSVTHACSSREPKRYVQKCAYGCGIIHGTEKCPRIQCKACANLYRRDNNATLIDGMVYEDRHICLIKSDLKDPVEFQRNGVDDGSKPCLLAWDIESAFAKVEKTKVFSFYRCTFKISKLMNKTSIRALFLVSQFLLMSMYLILFVSRMFLDLWK